MFEPGNWSSLGLLFVKVFLPVKSVFWICKVQQSELKWQLYPMLLTAIKSSYTKNYHFSDRQAYQHQTIILNNYFNAYYSSTLCGWNTKHCEIVNQTINIWKCLPDWYKYCWNLLTVIFWIHWLFLEIASNIKKIQN